MKSFDEKLNKLSDWFRQREKVIVAYSGGIDSTLLLKVATDALGPENALGVTSKSESLSEDAYNVACDIAEQMGFNHEVIEYSELAIPNYADNPVNRCFYCKHELFDRLRQLAEERGIDTVCEGSNFDDVGDHRPGMKAADKLEIHSPLKQFEITKAEIRRWAQDLGLPNWDRPSQACLSSRFPYGTKITKEGFEQVASGEKFLHDHGFTQVRCRHLGKTVKIELLPEEMPRLFLEDGLREELNRHMRSIGFIYVTLDLQGYRTGALNEVLSRLGKAK